MSRPDLARTAAGAYRARERGGRVVTAPRAEDTSRYRYGILGVGEIAEAIVTGLCAEESRAPTILLSPRGRDRAAALSARHASVTVARDNQAVLDGCATVVVCVRPADASAILAPLRVRTDHDVVSVMAGVRLAQLRTLLAPVATIARAIPLPTVARRAAPTPIHPGTVAARALFAEVGGATTVENEDTFDAMSAVTGTIAAHFRYLETIARWLGEQAIDAEEASRYVASIFAAVAETLAADSADLAALASTYATPGGLNERFAAMLQAAGTFELVERSLESIADGLRGPGADYTREISS